MLPTNALIAKSRYIFSTITAASGNPRCECHIYSNGTASGPQLRRIQQKPTQAQIILGHEASSGFCNTGHERQQRHDFTDRPKDDPSRRARPFREPIQNRPPAPARRPSKNDFLQFQRSGNRTFTRILTNANFRTRDYAQRRKFQPFANCIFRNSRHSRDAFIRDRRRNTMSHH